MTGISMREALGSPDLLANALQPPHRSVWKRVLGQQPVDTWATWKIFLIAAMGEPLTGTETETFKRFTGDRNPPTEPIKEGVFVIGRRGGKDKAVSVLASYLAAFRSYPMLTAGERGTLLVIAPDQSQATIQLNYIKGVFESSPLLRQRVVSETADSIALDNNIDIVVRSSNFRRLRGLTSVGVVASESAFWLNENSTNPDSEILRAIRPSLLTTGGPLIQISTPYAKQGELWKSFERYFGKDGPTLVVNAPSAAFNPTLPQADIDLAYQQDAEAARAEFGGEFRSDISSYIDRAAVMACVNGNVKEIGPRGGQYYAFVDPSGGRADSMTMCIAHEERERVYIDVLREVVPPFSPDTAVAEFASILKRYGVREVTGDRYGAEWVTEAFRKVGVTYKNSDLSASELFKELVPLLNTRTILLLENGKAIGQLCALERRAGRNGNDSISHPRGGFDDLAVAIAGAAWLAGTNASRRGEVRVGVVDYYNGRITWLDQRGRGFALSPDGGRNECIPSPAWLKANNK
jgi:hypothetical protein